MASLFANSSGTHASANSKRSYVTTAAFNGIIYSYTAGLNTSNFKQEGRLAPLTALPSGVAISATNCPAGRILRESGRKLYPGANPGLVLGDTYQGTTVANNNLNKMWVLVFDSVTGLRGFIDPNAPQFAVYNNDRNAAFVDVAETAGGAPTRLGQPVFTSGNITTTGGSVIQYKLVTALGTSGASTLTAAQTVGGVVTQTATGAQALNLPTTASLIAAMGSTVGTTCELTYINLAAQNVTLTVDGGGGTSIVGSAVVNNTSARFIIAIASATTVVVYRS
jgi:hypothetical protein